MAIRWAVVNGDWSNTATWNGGTLPAVDDDVFADGKTVAIDQNVTVLSIRTTQRSGGLAGGGFTISGNFNITATGVGILPGTTPCLTYNGDVVVALNANVTSSATAGAHGAVLAGNAASLTLTGNATGVSAGMYPIFMTGNFAILTAFGNMLGGGAGTTAHALSLTGSNAQVTVTGSLTGNPGGSALATTGNNAQVTVTGSVLGATANNGQGINMSGLASQLFITGDVAGRGANHGVVMGGAQAVATVVGNVTGGTGTTVTGMTMSGTSSLVTVTGTLTAIGGGNNHAIISGATVVGYGVIVSGNIFDAQNGTVAVYSRFLRIIASGTSGISRYANNVGFPTGTFINRVSPDLVTDVPSEEDVRDGIEYGYEDSLTGTLAVPSADSVAAGVAVDDTVGTAAVKLSDIAAVVGAQIAAAITNAGGE